MNEIKSLNLNHIVNIQEIRKENNILNINEKYYVNGNIENLDIEHLFNNSRIIIVFI